MCRRARVGGQRQRTSPNNLKILKLRPLILSVGEPWKQLKQFPSEASRSPSTCAILPLLLFSISFIFGSQCSSLLLRPSSGRGYQDLVAASVANKDGLGFFVTASFVNGEAPNSGLASIVTTGYQRKTTELKVA